MFRSVTTLLCSAAGVWCSRAAEPASDVASAGSALVLSRATVVRSTPTAILGNLMSTKKFGPPVVMGEESIMAPKAHGTSNTPVQQGLRWNCDVATADRICNFNR